MMTWMRKLLKSEAGFTLVELLIVLMVLGILATIAIPRFRDMSGKALQVKVKSELKQVQTAMDLYYAENTAYPANDADFETALADLIEMGSDLADYDFAYTADTANNDYSVVADYDNGSKTLTMTVTRDSIQ